MPYIYTVIIYWDNPAHSNAWFPNVININYIDENNVELEMDNARTYTFNRKKVRGFEVMPRKADES